MQKERGREGIQTSQCERTCQSEDTRNESATKPEIQRGAEKNTEELGGRNQR